MTVLNPNRTFGVELEVVTRRRKATLVNAINAEFERRGMSQAHCQAQQYNHSVSSYWKKVSDSTISPSRWEVVSPILSGFEGKAQIEAVCKALQNVGCTVNRSTGMHVHHDARDLSPKQIGQAFGTYAAFQTLLDLNVAPSRRGNQTYTRSVPTMVTNNGTDKWDGITTRRQVIRKLDQTKGSSRYSAMNHDSMREGSYQYHGTIEFRQHQGTTNATKVWAWILISQAIIEKGVQFKTRFPKTTASIGKSSYS